METHAVFNNVTDKSATLIPRGTYLIRVARLEPAESQLYGTPQVKWVFNVANKATGKPLLDADGAPVELWQYTTKNVTKHPKNKTRPWLECLLGRTLEDGEEGGPLADEVKGKKAEAFVDQVTNQSGKQRNIIQSMWPIGGSAPPAQPAEEEEDENLIPF